MCGGTVLGTGVWAAIHEAKPDHLQIIEELLDAGADVNEAGFPTRGFAGRRATEAVWSGVA